MVESAASTMHVLFGDQVEIFMFGSARASNGCSLQLQSKHFDIKISVQPLARPSLSPTYFAQFRENYPWPANQVERCAAYSSEFSMPRVSLQYFLSAGIREPRQSLGARNLLVCCPGSRSPTAFMSGQERRSWLIWEIIPITNARNARNVRIRELCNNRATCGR